MLTTDMATTKTTKPAKARKLTLAEVGREAAKRAQRDTLLAELRAQDWNLSAVARELGLSNPSNVLRSIKTLDLDAEYESAKDDGKIVKGPRSE